MKYLVLTSTVSTISCVDVGLLGVDFFSVDKTGPKSGVKNSKCAATPSKNLHCSACEWENLRATAVYGITKT